MVHGADELRANEADPDGFHNNRNAQAKAMIKILPRRNNKTNIALSVLRTVGEMIGLRGIESRGWFESRNSRWHFWQLTMQSIDESGNS